jgi:hypothetical protein
MSPPQETVPFRLEGLTPNTARVVTIPRRPVNYINFRWTAGVFIDDVSLRRENSLSIHLESKDLINAQQMEVAINGPDGATT